MIASSWQECERQRMRRGNESPGETASLYVWTVANSASHSPSIIMNGDVCPDDESAGVWEEVREGRDGKSFIQM